MTKYVRNGLKVKDTILHLFKEKFNKDFYEYVSFCLENKYDVIDDTYCELHHILPKSKFPEFKKSEWNIVRLKYNDHVNAHLILAEIHPIKAFTRPLEFLTNINDEIREKLPLLQEIGINEWKNSERYTKFVEKCSIRNIERYKDDAEREKLSNSCKRSWENKPHEEKQKHIDERSIYNKSEIARKKNSEGVRRAYADGTLSKKLSEISKGKVWWNDGSTETKSFESPGENWNRGRITKFTKEQIDKRNKTLKEKKLNEN